MIRKQIPKRSWLLLLQLSMIAFLLMIMVIHGTNAQTFPSNFQRVTIASGLSSPSAMEFMADGRILVCQKGGSLRVIKNGSLLATPAITLSVNTSGERGLIGVTVDPNFATNKFVYLYYSTSGTVRNRVSRFVMTGDVLGSETVILDFPVDGHMYHNGGGIAFGADGKLYILAGDDKNGANSQNLDSPFGKVLRINSDGSIPTGNPFTGGTTRSKVWAYGVRNPYTLARDPSSTKLFVNDVGESTWEEVDDATLGGRNFGWPSTEGSGSNLIYKYATNRNDPPPNGQGCAISGGTFFNGSISNYPSTYGGKYFFLDYCGGWIDYINPSVTSPTRTLFASGLPSGMLYIKQNPNDGNLYYINISNGNVYKIVYNSPAPVITQHPQSITVPVGGTASFSVTATGTAPLSYQWKKNGTNITGATSTTYTINNVQTSHAGTYTVTVTNSGGSATSNPATLTVTTPPVATITSPANGAIFRGGDVISFSGTGSDNEDGNLPASAFTWWIDIHHETHTHPGPELADGVTSGSFTISTVGNSEQNTWYRIYLMVTDSQGATNTTFVEIFPKVSNLTLQTVPAGLQLKLDEVPLSTPVTTGAISGTTRPIEAISPQTVSGTTYIFDHWGHGGAASQTITITDNDATYTAHFRVAPTPIVLPPTNDAYVRDGTNAGITFGTTDPTVLITKVSPTGQLNNARESYLMFDAASIAGTISSATLRVYGKVDLTTTPSVPVGVFSVANTTWTESTITWNNKPASGSTALSTVTVTNTAFVYYDFDVTSYVQSERAAGRTKVSFAMKSLAAHDPRIFWNSKEFGSNPPQLSIIAEAGNAGPVVSITSPSNGATFTTPANVTINANASDSDGVTKVEFFQNGTTKLGEDLLSPYSFTWSNAPTGTHTLTAVATDSLGASTTSAGVTITVQNTAPSVSITSPLNGATFTAPATVNIAANASDSNGSVAKVEFFQGATKLGEDIIIPYEFTWSNVAAGSYSLTAKATDDLGAVTTSAAVSITVSDPSGLPAPWVNQDIGAVAAAGSATHSGGTFTVKGSGADIWNTADEFHYVYQPASGDVELIARVSSITNTNAWAKAGLKVRESLAAGSINAAVFVSSTNGVTFQRRTATSGTSVSTVVAGIPAPVWLKLTRAGNNFTASYSTNGTTWTAIGTAPVTMAANTQVGLAVTSHADGTVATAPFTNVSVSGANAAPTVSITSPANNSAFATPATVSINANAADSDGTVTKVEFFNGATKLGEALASPYSFTWSNVAAGSYSLTAVATDNGGRSTTSTAVAITVNPCDVVIASADDGNVAANVLDNNLATRWSASGDPQWIKFCLASTQSVSGIQIAFFKGNERTSSFDVELSLDGTNFTPAAPRFTSSGTSLALETFSFAAQNARYVRIVGHGNSLNLWNSYTEVEINTAAPLSGSESATARQRSAEEVETSSTNEPDLSCHPNPTHGLMTITYKVKEDGWVKLSVDNSTNNQKFILVDKHLSAGTYQSSFDTRPLPNGVHIIKLVSNGKLSVHKLLKH